MTKAIRSYSKGQQREVVVRRLAVGKNGKGLGYFAALGWEKWMNSQVAVAPVLKVAVEEVKAV